MTSILRRCLGAALLALTLLPLHRLLGGERGGLAGAALRERAEAVWELLLWGGVLVLAAGTLASVLLPAQPVRSAARRVGRALGDLPSGAFALGAGALATVLAAAVQRLVLLDLPGLGDEMVSLAHGRWLAEGHLLGPVPEPAAGWMIPNSVLLAEGWVSQYPPLHPLLLAAGLAVGAAWLVGPVLTGILVAASAGAADLLLEGRRGAARVGVGLVALSPFVLLLGAGYTSHVPAAAFLACCLYLSLRARAGGALWAVGAGAAMGAAVTTRPWTGVVLGAAFTFGLWGVAARAEGGRWWLRRALGATLGGAPFAAGLLAYSSRVFGDGWTLGYTVAWGRSHGLGFGTDPWGNAYGPLEAVGASAAELLSLSNRLLETPLPAVGLVGAWLLLARRLPRGAGVLLAWALLPVAANALYWHHGLHHGPRMLYESAPAWVLLTVLAAVAPAGDGDAATGPGAGPVGERGADTPGGRPDGPRPGRSADAGPAGARARDALAWSLAVALVGGAVLFVPDRLAVASWDREALERVRAPEVPGSGPALVFVHTSWSERVGARLQAAGMRLDSVETALRRNGLCRVHRYVEARTAGERPLPALRMEPLPSAPRSLREVRVSPGYSVLLESDGPLSADCRAELASDRHGVISLAPLLWQGDLPGAEAGRPLFVRDLGPDDNRRILERFPGRTPWVFAAAPGGAPPRLLPYDEGERELWGGAAGASRTR